jgi:hypothetical protein
MAGKYSNNNSPPFNSSFIYIPTQQKKGANQGKQEQKKEKNTCNIHTNKRQNKATCIIYTVTEIAPTIMGREKLYKSMHCY